MGTPLMLDQIECRRLRQWGRQHERPYPWRSTKSRYELAVAEILLQKTKAEDAVPVWLELVDAYPSARALRLVPDRRVHELVRRLGLGHQRTARLKAACESLSSEAVDAIPGLGRYGSAIVALAGDGRLCKSHVPVDGNIARIVTRYKGLKFQRGEPRKKKEVHDAVAAMLQQSKSRRDKLRLIYSLVDLGAATCTPMRPACSTCPLRDKCAFAVSAASGPGMGS